MDLRKELKDGAIAGAVSGLSMGVLIYVLYLGMLVLTLLDSSEQIEPLRMISFAVVTFVLLPLIGAVPGAPLALVYGKLTDRVERHDLAFAAVMAALVVAVAAVAGLQFLTLFVPVGVYIVALERRSE